MTMTSWRRLPSWKTILSQQLPLLGHRNWIVIADAAYPWQTAPGIETVCTGENHLTVIRQVLKSIGAAAHVRPVLYTDAELPRLSEKDASGIRSYTKEFHQLLLSQEIHSLPHEQIIQKLDEAGQVFRVLLLKTTLTLPYTTLFVQLDCGYWSVDAERRLRRGKI